MQLREKLLFFGIVNIMVIGFFTIFYHFFISLPYIFLINFVVLPIYLLLSRWKLSESEKIIFSLFLAVGGFPTVVYTLGRVMSLVGSIVLTTGLLWATILLIKNRDNNKNNGKTKS